MRGWDCDCGRKPKLFRIPLLLFCFSYCVRSPSGSSKVFLSVLSCSWPLVNEVYGCVTFRCVTLLRQFCLCAQSFASRPVPYREACGGNGNGRRVVGCCCCCWRFSSIGFCFCNFCGVLKLLGTHSLELPFNPD